MEKSDPDEGAEPVPGVEAAIARIVTMPDRGTATRITWRGDDAEGRHSGYGSLAALRHPTDSPVRLMGTSYYHNRGGEMLEEWTVHDEMSLMT